MIRTMECKVRFDTENGYTVSAVYIRNRGFQVAYWYGKGETRIDSVFESFQAAHDHAEAVAEHLAALDIDGLATLEATKSLRLDFEENDND